MTTADTTMPQRFLSRAFNLQAGEARPVCAGFAMFFLLFAGYFMLRPVRETMGITGGVDNLQWLFTGTFFATLAAMPLFGWIAGCVRRRRILYWVYGVFAANLLLFAAGFIAKPDDVWLARAFYIWLSVFNMIAISLAWSVLVDLFAAAKARRVFALMAAGARAGGLAGRGLLGMRRDGAGQDHGQGHGGGAAGGLHGVGGIVGAVLVGPFSAASLGGVKGDDYAIGAQTWIQIESVALTIVFSGVISFVLFKLVGLLVGGLRVETDSERQGLDQTSHGESAYHG